MKVTVVYGGWLQVYVLREHYLALLLALFVFAAGAAEGQLFSEESYDQSAIWRGPALNDVSIYKQIDGVELRKHSTFVRHPYEVVIPNSVFGTFYFCQLFDADEQVVVDRFQNAGRGETHIFFKTKEPATSAACVDARDPKVDAQSP